MPLDGIVTGAIATELQNALVGGKIEKIYQPERDELVLMIREGGQRHKLYISCSSNHCGAYLSNEDYSNPPTPTSFCMLMRKHLQGNIITDIRQMECERIIQIYAEGYDELRVKSTKQLIVEIMGRHSNIILCQDENQKIIDSVKRTSLDAENSRQLLPGLTYEYPPTRGKISFYTLTEMDVEILLSKANERELSDRLLTGVQGISPLISRELCRGAEKIDFERMYDEGLDINKDEIGSETKANQNASDDENNSTEATRLIYRNIANLQSRLRCHDLVPCVYGKEEGSPDDFHVVPINQYKEGYEKKIFESPSETLAYFYSHRDISNRISQKTHSILRQVNATLKKLRLKEQRLSEDLVAAQNSEHYRICGEILTANIHALKRGQTKVTLTNYYDGSDITINLDEKLDPSKNAQKYFKKYNKAKRAVKEKQAQLELTHADIEYLDSVHDALERAASIEELDEIKRELIDTGFIRSKKVTNKRKKDNPSPYVYKSSAGLNILSGRNNKENDYLTFKVAGKNDIWLHTKDIPGSHVILFAKNKTPDDKSLHEAACVAAYHSKGRNSENVPVDYTKVRYVKKPNGAKPGMVIFTDNKTMYVEPKLPEK